MIDHAYAEGAHSGRPDFAEGATSERILQLETKLGLRLPTALREFLGESDGLGQMAISYGNWERVHTELWSCDKIARENESIRADPEGPPPPPDAPGATPLYFADPAVDGILFAFLVRPSGDEDPGVYACYPIENEWRLISPTLEVHLRSWTV
jgi:hypothetical protein